ncbi:MAG: hypothetical protein GZ093_11835 [Rhodoferax sp.]|uniref:hypothetical protein n=1 Tax=Rhodoferax sp. TaxID=50421 RepID=UPI001400BBF7|nr:hypothetical protein [Rhodoferax sp.]NDP39421.1 hypothetical protein [Rhodoferax sp.]
MLFTFKNIKKPGLKINSNVLPSVLPAGRLDDKAILGARFLKAASLQRPARLADAPPGHALTMGGAVPPSQRES